MIGNATFDETRNVSPAEALVTASDEPDRTLAGLGLAGSGLAGSGNESGQLGDEIVAALKTVYDPEIPADLYELGLIYKIAISDDRLVTIDLTLTTPNCPAAAVLPGQVQKVVGDVPGVRGAQVNIVWDPPWNPSRMSEEARWVLDIW